MAANGKNASARPSEWKVFETRPELVLIEGVWGSVSVFKLCGIAHRVKEQKQTLYRGFYAALKWKD